MHLRSIKLFNFKNYEALSLDLSPRLNCFTGLNGMGKTNVLDAVYFLCLCRSHLSLNDKQMIRHGEGFFRVEGVYEGAEGRDKIAIKYKSGDKKEVERNGVPYARLTDYIGQFPVVMIAPGDIDLVQEGSEERRRFFDATLSQISAEYLHNLLLYNALLKQRNALLKTFAAERRFDATLLEAIDRQMPAPAQVLYERRAAFTIAFEPLLQSLYALISGDREQVSVRYDSDLETRSFSDVLMQNIEKDRVLERTAQGPHRDDLELLMNGQAVRKFASQGQMKSFLLAMRLAQYAVLQAEKGFAPLLLLDDIFDKLDAQRVRQLIALLLERNFGQIFITDTQRERIEHIVAAFTGEYKLFEVDAGRIA
jgi:DNA replication and repair protein RecF